MTSALCSAPLTSFKASQKPGNCMGIHVSQKQLQYEVFRSFAATKFSNLKAKVLPPMPFNYWGAVLCSQCKGSGVNSVDLFNGQFKAGDSCWLCGECWFCSLAPILERGSDATMRASLEPKSGGSIFFSRSSRPI
ncbi:hypothetical protein CJ030_MR8G012686 [Morella rubra]|uniref:BSD2 cysteine rich domain-containing protein n=1 Tax=Morella rubra TaxID=262757 RepID=A0A6A1UVZ6_9ROSI|nr:hypothetical protein CJ030_MR8G012686 [Morella rubra]